MEEEVELKPRNSVAGMKVIDLNRSRMRAIYYWKGENGAWNPTGLLPADPYSQAYYFAKGFKAKPPVDSTQETFSCPTCEFEAKSAFGLQAHQRKHEKEEK